MLNTQVSIYEFLKSALMTILMSCRLRALGIELIVARGLYPGGGGAYLNRTVKSVAVLLKMHFAFTGF